MVMVMSLINVSQGVYPYMRFTISRGIEKVYEAQGDFIDGKEDLRGKHTFAYYSVFTHCV